MENLWNDLVRQFTKTFITDNRWKVFLTGFQNTLLITVIAALIGILIGTVVSVVHYFAVESGRKPGSGRWILVALDRVLAFYVSLMRGTPLAIQLTIMAFIIMAGFPNKLAVCCAAFGINSGAYVSEVIRGGIQSVDRGQSEAGLSLGLTSLMTMQMIVLLQAVKNILPALCNEFIAEVKGTSLASVFFIPELTTSYRTVQSTTFLSIQPLLIAGMIYLFVTTVLSWAVRRMERRLKASD